MSDRAAIQQRAREAFAGLLSELPGNRPALVTVAVGPGAPESLWNALPDEDAVLWETPDGRAWGGVGAALAFEGEGEACLGIVQQQIGELPALWARLGGGEKADAEVAFFGGAAFQPQGAGENPWNGWGDARFVLPRWSWQRREKTAYLTFAALPGTLRCRDTLWQEFERILQALAAPLPDSLVVSHGAVVHEEDEGRWVAAVAAARAAIDAGLLDKVVLVRRTDVDLPGTVDPVALLRSLSGEGAGLFRFGFRFRGRSFVGASPELLVARSGDVVRAEALAASLPRPHKASRDVERALAIHLAGDAKQRREHELVVEALRAELEPLCRSLDVPAKPEVRVLRHLLHLSTPVTGHLATPVPLLELAARLHPTPAVAGKPRDRALEFVSRYEAHRRGWFAGPVGRVTLGGEGELAVALRSVLVSGNRAFVYAGAGIVAGSDAVMELAETRAKARTCLAALGVEV